MRIRTIKPDFFSHEGLYDLERSTKLPIRLAYIGLWCVADREGRFRWEPRRLGTKILPYDGIEFSRVLDALMTGAFLRKYRVNDVEYGVIPTFKKHQIVNPREKASIIPEAPPIQERDATGTRQPREGHAGVQEGEWEKERERSSSALRAEPPDAPNGTLKTPPEPPPTPTPEARVDHASITPPPRVETPPVEPPPVPETTGIAHADFIHRWTSEYPTHHDGEGYKVLHGKDGSAVKSLLKTGKTVDELMRIAVHAWAHPSEFWCKQAVTIAGFNSKFNEIRQELNELRAKKKKGGQKEGLKANVADL